MTTIDDTFIQEISDTATTLRQQYTEEALLALLEAEQIRILREDKISLGSPKEIVSNVTKFIIDKLKENRIVTNALLMTYVVNNVVEYLISQNIISQANISRERFVVALVVSIVMDTIYKAWEKYRNGNP